MKRSSDRVLRSGGDRNPRRRQPDPAAPPDPQRPVADRGHGRSRPACTC